MAEEQCFTETPLGAMLLYILIWAFIIFVLSMGENFTFYVLISLMFMFVCFLTYVVFFMKEPLELK